MCFSVKIEICHNTTDGSQQANFHINWSSTVQEIQFESSFGKNNKSNIFCRQNKVTK